MRPSSSSRRMPIASRSPRCAAASTRCGPTWPASSSAAADPVNVLVANHTGLVSGGEVVTLDLLQSLEPSVHAVLACPEGPLADRARDAGVTVAPVAGMAGSLRLHPVETPRAIKDLVTLGGAIAALARRTAADVVYAASIRAGLAASLPV